MGGGGPLELHPPRVLSERMVRGGGGVGVVMMGMEEMTGRGMVEKGPSVRFLGSSHGVPSVDYQWV